MSNDDDSARKARQDDITRLRRSAAHGEIPEPPYSVRDVEMLYLMCRFAPETVAAVMPEGLRPAASGWGPITMFTAGSGWGITPYSALFMAMEVEGFDSPDGSLGMYMHSGLYSDRGGRAMRGRYNRNFGEGRTRLWREGDRVVGETSLMDGTPVVRVTADVTNPVIDPLSGVHRYLGRDPNGDGLTIYTVSFSGEFVSVEPRSVEFLSGAEDLLRVVQPLEFVWPVYIRNLSMTYGAPRPLELAEEHVTADSYGVGVVSIFARMGRPAGIVGRDGRIVTLNAAAEAMLDRGSIRLGTGHLFGGHPDRDRHLDLMIAGTGQGGAQAGSDRILLAAGTGSGVMVRAVALDPRIAGPDKFLVLFSDPASDRLGDAGPALQMLGLTPAEARVAAMVGAGRSPREAADALDLSLNTVRSALKLAYDKLGVRRQSELAKLVTRLED